MTDEATSFRKNYETLRLIAQRLNSNADLDIDQLVPLIEEATMAYRACQARLTAVERLLAEKLGDGRDRQEWQ